MTRPTNDRRRSPLPRLAPMSTNLRLRRLAWNLARLLLFRPTPIAWHRWRAGILRAFGARIEGRVYPYPDIAVWAPWNLHMATESCLGPGVICYNVALLSLGHKVTVSQRTHLCTASHDFDDPGFPLTGAPIKIEDDAWVAAEAFLGPGVTIGKRAVVLARTVVARDVPSGTVVGGNPARHLRERACREGENF